MDELRESGLAQRCQSRSCSVASDEAVTTVHSPFHLQRLQNTRRFSLERLLDEAEQYDSVYLNEHSASCALLAAGGVLDMADSIWKGHLRNGLALVRPASHHASKHTASGFCLLNSIAIASHHLLRSGCERVLIVDWDIHHGDGTQQAFLEDDRVLFFSVHRQFGTFPHKAGAGPETVGRGNGEGFNVNIAWNSPGMGDAEYAYAWRTVLLPLMRMWQPQVVLVSAGFDAVQGDPIGDCSVSPAGFGWMARRLVASIC